MPPFRFRALLAIALFASGSARASSTLCTFTVPDPAQRYELDLLGYTEIQQVLLHSWSAGGPVSLPGGSYRVREFDLRGERIHLEYTNPGNAALPPSFTLHGAGARTTMRLRGRTIVGAFRCGP